MSAAHLRERPNIPIEDVNVGDTVKASDPTTGQVEDKPVTQLHINRDRDLTDVTITKPTTAGSAVADSPAGGAAQSSTSRTGVLVATAALALTATLHTTDHHQFFDQTTKAWTDAADLQPDRSTLTTPDG